MTKKNFIKGLLKTLINHTGTKVIFIFAVLTVLCYCMGTIITEVENVSPKSRSNKCPLERPNNC